MISQPLLVAAILCAGAHGVLAQDRDHSAIESPFAEYVEPGFPFFCQTVDARGVGEPFPGNNLVPRGIVLNLGEGLHACFDSDLLRVALVWKENADGEYLEMNGMAPGSYRQPSQKAPAGQGHLPEVIGEAVSGTGIYPGWQGAEVAFTDPREPSSDPREVGLGPVAEELGRWEGLYLDEASRRTPLLAYRVMGTRVLEDIGAVVLGRGPVYSRSLLVGPHRDELSLVIDEGGRVRAYCESGEVRRVEGRLVVTFSASDREREHRVVVAPPGFEDGVALISKFAKPRFADFGEPGDGRWPESVDTRGVLSRQEGAYVIDEVPLPLPNPWKRNVRLSGLDFFADGRAAVSTFDGDVWLVEGLAGDLERVSWRRFASGLHEPMGLCIVDGRIYVFDRNGIVRLEDSNGDGETDFYENFSNIVAQTAETREFAMDLLEKPGGGFYLAKGGQVGSTFGKYNGTIVEVSADGRSCQVIARGLRQPFAGIDPESGMVTASDQQGHWVPATPVRLIEEGSYHGFIPTIVENPVQKEPITEPPVWIPHIVNQSGASQVWLRGSSLGPLDDSLIHIGYNRPELFKVYLDGGGSMTQGAVATAATGFPCALLKGAVNPADGTLFVCGFRIWGTALDQVSGLFRVRHTGAVSHVPAALLARERGIFMRFDFVLDEEIAANPGSYTVERWNYKRTKQYGSGHYRIDGEPGQETMPVTSVTLSDDGQAVFLGIPDMRPVHSMRVTYRLATPGDVPVVQSAYLTVHELRRFGLAKAGFANTEVDLTVDAVAAAAAAAPEPCVEEGVKAYQMFGCMACHTVDGSQVEAAPGLVVGPTWKGLWGSRRELADGTIVKNVDAVYLRESILEPGNKMAKGFENMGVGMPSYLGVMKDWQIDSLILYIESLK